MMIHQSHGFSTGYTPVTELHGQHSWVSMDFGILVLDRGMSVECSLEAERAWLLIHGKVEFTWDGYSSLAERQSCIDQTPEVLHVPSGTKVSIVAIEDAELCVQRVENTNQFPARMYHHGDVRSEVFGSDTLEDTTVRTVRTVFDGATAPLSNMVLGEVVNHQGRWSSYPPHHHPHPEIYHYRLFPRQGFGVAVLDENPLLVSDGDSLLIPPGATHAQVAAPGYTMYYIWMIPHLPGNRWMPTTRYVAKQHAWMTGKPPMAVAIDTGSSER